MKFSISTKLFVSSGLLLVLLGVAAFGILSRAQEQLVLKQMDALLENQLLSLSALVSARPQRKFDFEISPIFLSQYKQSKPNEFFKFAEVPSGAVFQQSSGAPDLNCESFRDRPKDTLVGAGRTFRVKSNVFKPDIENEFKSLPPFEATPICLIVGVDEAPYRSLVRVTTLATIPRLLGLVVLVIGLLLLLVRGFTRDLVQLANALSGANFKDTHEFPNLPKTKTLEVNAVVTALNELHVQVTDVYREMWLFLGRAAHQIKTPVAAMQATLQVLLRKDRSKEELLSGLRDVETATALLGGLTKKLISSSRISYEQTNRKIEIPLDEFLSNQVDVFKSQCEQRGVSIHLELQAHASVLADEFLLSELFGNLIENAIFYTGKAAKSRISVESSIEGENIVTLISDQGEGFSPQVRNALFQPFTRGDERSVAGSGLGLFISHKAAQLLGGKIELKKSDSTGSVISVILPRI